MSKLGAAIAGILALSVIAVGVDVWISLGESEMSAGGYLAMIFGALAALGLGVGLMALLFYSNRKGFDEEAAGSPPPNDRRSPD